MSMASNPETRSDAVGSKPVADTCAHCGLPVPKGLRCEDEGEQFCCAGCRSVYQMIHGCGLGRYYDIVDSIGRGSDPPTAPTPGGRYEVFDDPAFVDSHVMQRDDGLSQIDLRLSNVHCAACVWLVERLPRVLPGVIEVRLSLKQNVARVTWDAQRVELSRVAEQLDRLGYPPYPAAKSQDARQRLEGERRMLVRVGIAGACAGNAMLLALAMYAGLLDGMDPAHERFLRWVSLGIGVVSLAWPGRVFFRGALTGLRMRVATLDVPIALALLVGGVAGAVNVVTGRGEVYFDSLCVLVFLLLVGRYVQMRQHRRATDAVSLMRSLTPMSCSVWRAGAWTQLPMEALQGGDRVRVLSGENIPVDGSVLRGESTVDRASLTGEALPQRVGPDDDVFAGCLNVGAPLEVLVNQFGKDTRLARLMEDAAAGVSGKPGIVRLADRIAGVFTVSVVLLAVVVFTVWSLLAGVMPAIDHAVALLIVACPCALGLATPLTLSMAVGVAARRDLLVKDAAVFEKLAAVSPRRPGVLAIDKTGTLTTGELTILAWGGDTALQPLVAALERDSRHPVGRALHLAYAADEVPPATSTVEDPRGGISGDFAIEGKRQTVRIGSARFLTSHGLVVDGHHDAAVAHWLDKGCTVVWMACSDEVKAYAVLSDTPRPECGAVLRGMDACGWTPRILSGDVAPPVKHVAGCVGIPADRALASLTPEDKAEHVRTLSRGGAAVTMVGDGVNDAVALACADVGIAVQGGAEAALTVADVYAARPGLVPIGELLGLSRFTMRVIRGNLGLSLAYNAVAVGLAATGLLSPWIAAILMPVSSASVLGLAIYRLTRWQGGNPCR